MASLHPIPPFNQLTYYPTARWIRATRGGDTIVDSRHALLVWEPGLPTRYYLPSATSTRRCSQTATYRPAARTSGSLPTTT
jgi:uncharacterized protein (DUF427 family)